jgi:TonB family protein
MVATSGGKRDEGHKQQASPDQPSRTFAPTDHALVAQGDKTRVDSAADNTEGSPFIPGKNGIGFPSCVYCPNPKHSEEARIAKISGTVTLRIVIEPDGHPSDIQIVKMLSHGPDNLAVQAVQNWRFEPATRPDGKAVPTTVPIEIDFQSK